MRFPDGKAYVSGRCLAIVEGRQCKRKIDRGHMDYRGKFCWQHSEDAYPLTDGSYGGCVTSVGFKPRD